MGLSMAVSEVLKMEGFAVTAVMDGLAADEILQKEHFDMVVLDIMMPGMEGTICFAPTATMVASGLISETSSGVASVLVTTKILPLPRTWRSSHSW